MGLWFQTDRYIDTHTDSSSEHSLHVSTYLCFTPFSTVFQLYHGGQCTYPCILVFPHQQAALHTQHSFWTTHCQLSHIELSHSWETNEYCRNWLSSNIEKNCCRSWVRSYDPLDWKPASLPRLGRSRRERHAFGKGSFVSSSLVNCWFSPCLGKWAIPGGTAIPGRPVARAEQAPDFSPVHKNQFNIEVPLWGTYQILSW